MIEETKFETFREQHAQLSFHVAALMVAVLRQREAEHMVALGQLGNAGGVKTTHRSRKTWSGTYKRKFRWAAEALTAELMFQILYSPSVAGNQHI